MRAQNVAQPVGQSRLVDVDMSQGQALGIFSFYSRYLWDIVNVDRSQAVYPSERGSAQCTALEKNRSRGCRALRSPFLRCAWLPLWQLAPSPSKRLFTWMSQPSPLNLSIPASTSNHQGRAHWANARPALFLSADQRSSGPQSSGPQSAGRLSAGYHRHCTHDFATAIRANYGDVIRNDNNWRPSCGQHQSLPFSFLAWLQPVPSLRQSRCPWKSRLRLSQHQPANTNDLTWRAGSFRPARLARLNKQNADLKVWPC